MYIEKTYIGINAIEHEISYKGNYGAKGEKRAPKVKRTPEQIERQNRVNKENRVRRTIQANFCVNDYWTTLNYPAGTRKSYEEVRNDFNKFRRQLRTEYLKRGEELKYIARIEIGKRGGIHIHFLVNRIWGADLLIQKCWVGRCHFSHLYEDGGFRQLASYLTKELPEDSKRYKQMGFIDDADIRGMSTYIPSRNLVKPEPEKKEYKRRTVRKLLANGPVAKSGFYIDKESIHIGVNQYTGYTYMKYTEIRLEPIERQLKPPEELDGSKHIHRKRHPRGKGKRG